MAALAAGALAGGLAGTGAPAGAQSGADAVAACETVTAVPEVGPRACKSVEAGTWLAAQWCRRAVGTEEPVCPTVDGRQVGARAMKEHRASWVARALDLQRDMDRDVPLVQALLPHTHNSANSAAYRPSVTTNDANQILSLTDQLELGIRGIEIDLHWVPYPDPSRDPAQAYRDVVQCHGRTEQTGVTPVHVGCSVDQPVAPLLEELRTWLGKEGNEDEVVLLYLENQLDDAPAAHARAAELIAQELGGLVHRPGAGGCQTTLPVRTISKREVVAGGGQVLITGDCGPEGSPWNTWVFDRGNNATWDESGGTTNYACRQDRDELLTTSEGSRSYENTFIRRYEDSTWVSAMTVGGSHIAEVVLADMVRCGVNLPGLDQVHPGDDRLGGLVWSWRSEQPRAGAGSCAAQGDDARFFAADCAAAKPVACRTADGGWAVSTDAVPWASAQQACAADGHIGAGVPFNGWDNGLLRTVAAGRGDVWLAYARDGEGNWVTGVPAPSDPPTERPGRGHGGKPSQPGPPAGTKPTTPRADGVTPVRVSSSSPIDTAGLAALGIGLAVTALAAARRRRG